MGKINRHGLRMIGLKKAAGETKGLHGGRYATEYVQISYNMETGEIYTNYHCSIGQNWQTVYHDPAIIHICNAGETLTMQDIADLIHCEVQWRIKRIYPKNYWENED